MKTPLQNWVDEQIALMQPDKVYWMDGSEEEGKKLAEIGEKEQIDGHPVLEKLNQKEFYGAYWHRSNSNDVARTEQLTFICLPNKEDAGPNNNWMDPTEAKAKLNALFKGCMKGRTMYVIPFLMGSPKSPYSKCCVEVTDSVYVAISMRIMTRTGKVAIDKIGNSTNFFKGMHSIGDVNPERRYIMHFPQENLVMSFGSGYGGNALLGKKCCSLRIGSYLGYKEGWLAEHMIIIGVEAPDGKKTYFLGSFPSACGKTNLALLNPVLKGYKVWTLGDDIAWINVGPDGRLYAMNPEMGFFGVAPGTGKNTNPIMVETLKNNKFFPTLYTNTAVDSDTKNPWWEGYSEMPENIIDWHGKKYDKNSGEVAAHKNSRFTVSTYNCPTLAKEFDDPQGVPISGIIFGGRRKSTIPLVYESTSWENGVFDASIIGSEMTAAAGGKLGTVRRDPMSMLPFCGYNMGDYFGHWLSFAKRAKVLPKIFMVNWFRKDEDGNYMWPGFRDNSRVLKWMIDRIEGKVQAEEKEIGLFPKVEDLDLSGLDISKETLEKLFKVSKEEWQKEIPLIEEFYAKFGDRLPKELRKQLDNLKKKFGI